jgi:hypothetical protein
MYCFLRVNNTIVAGEAITKETIIKDKRYAQNKGNAVAR